MVKNTPDVHITLHSALQYECFLKTGKGRERARHGGSPTQYSGIISMMAFFVGAYKIYI